MTDIGGMLFRLNFVLSLSILGGIGTLAPILHLGHFRNSIATLVALVISVVVLLLSLLMPLINLVIWKSYRQKQLGRRSVDPEVTLDVDVTEFSYFITGSMQCGAAAILLMVTWFWFWTDDFMNGYFPVEHQPYAVQLLPYMSMQPFIPAISLFYGILIFVWQLASMGVSAFVISFVRESMLLIKRTVGIKIQATILYIAMTVGSMLAMLATLFLVVFGLLNLIYAF